MKLSLVVGIAVLSATLLAAPVPASARDLCLQMAGNSCDFTGESGFFRLMKFKMPRNARKAVPVHGRNAGLTGVYGTAVMNTDESMVSIAASFTQDGVFGTVDISISPENLFHAAYSSYGDVGLSNECLVWIAPCDLEP